MDQFINRKTLNELLHLGDIQNSLDGGRSAVYSRMNVRNNAYELELKIPSVDVNKLVIEVAERELKVYNFEEKIIEEGKYLALPANYRSYALPANADKNNIEAIEMGLDEVLIRIPIGAHTFYKRKRIKIKNKDKNNL